MREEELLQEIISQNVNIADVNAWLDDAIEDTDQDAGVKYVPNKQEKWSRYDRLSFVVIVLNFLREDAAPLLSPGDCAHLADRTPHPSSIEDGPIGTPKKAGNLPSNHRSLGLASNFDISSTEDFPSLAIGDKPRSGGGTNRQKRRIRPTSLSRSEKPHEVRVRKPARIQPLSEKHLVSWEDCRSVLRNSIFQTTSNAWQSPIALQRWLSRMDDAAAGLLPVRSRRSGNPEPSLALSEASKAPRRTVLKQEKELTIAHGVDTAPGALMSKADKEIPARGHLDNRNGARSCVETTSGSPSSISAHSVQRNPSEPKISGAAAGANLPCIPSGFAREPHTESTSVECRCSVARSRSSNDSAICRQEEHPAVCASHVKSLACAEVNNAATGRTPAKSTAAAYTQPLLNELCDGVEEAGRSQHGGIPSAQCTIDGRKWNEDSGVATLASIYAHAILRGLVPNLATEMHLTVRLLHVHPTNTRDSLMSSCDRIGMAEQSSTAREDSACSFMCANRDDDGGDQRHEKKTVFNTGLDCRAFAARVLLGLEPLLSYMGADILDLLSGSLTPFGECEELMEEVRHVLSRARGDTFTAIKDANRDQGRQNADDTSIVQNIGAPFAALQWREEDSVNLCRTSAERALFQNRQESVDRFGSLLRDFQRAKKGLQQHPDRALQDLRTGASALVDGLARENFGWIAQYFLAQLMGWGLAPQQETDSEVMALVAPAGDRGRETLQKLHRRISAPSSREGESMSKSSRKLRHPPAHSRQEPKYGLKQSEDIADGIHTPSTGQLQRRARKPEVGSRRGKGPNAAAPVYLLTAPLQLSWFPGNQEFFYQVLLALDSHALNHHLKTALVAEIARLYDKQSERESSPADTTRCEGFGRAVGDDSRTTNEGVEGFTARMVKLKVLAKFLGLLTFSPNWGVSADSISNLVGAGFQPTISQDYTAEIPLPLQQYLSHAWATEGLVGAVPWVADFLRMMKWDAPSMQASPYRSILATLATVHAQPRMRPAHPAFTQSLLAVSCEIETLFQDLGFDLGVHGYNAVPPLSDNVLVSKNLDLHVLSSPQDADMIGTTRRPLLPATRLRPRVGSLDEDVVLSRRLIQNCWPFLEDLLGLISGLDNRTRRLGMAHGDEASPLRPPRFPHGVPGAGVSPRGKRVIKPHPLRPLPAMPSVPEHQITSAGTTHAQYGDHTDSARVRLVEAFFHAKPGELQITADFVVRRAVHNACEEVLVAVVRPAITAAVRQMHLASIKHERTTPTCSTQDTAMSESSSTGNSNDGGLFGVGSSSARSRLEQRIEWLMGALHERVGSKSKLLARKRGQFLANGCALALVQRSLPLRVRESAATIAGHHAKFAAERKIEELTTTAVREGFDSFPSPFYQQRTFRVPYSLDCTVRLLNPYLPPPQNVVSEAGLACHLQLERELKGATVAFSLRSVSPDEAERPQSAGRNTFTRGKTKLDSSSSITLPQSSPTSRLPGIVMALSDAGRKLGADSCGEDELLQAAVSLSVGNGQDLEAVSLLVRKTLDMVQSTWQLQQRARSGTPVGTITASMGQEHDGHDSAQGMQDSLDRRRVLGEQKANTTAKFLGSLAELWGVLYADPMRRHGVMKCFRDNLCTTMRPSGSFEHVLHLANCAVEAYPSDVEIHKRELKPQQDRRPAVLSFCRDRPWGAPAEEENSPDVPEHEYLPWFPAVQLIVWGAISAARAEDILLSCVHKLTVEQRSADRNAHGAHRTSPVDEADQLTSRDAVLVVVAGVVKSYHSWATHHDMSRVSLPNLSERAKKLQTQLPHGTTDNHRYHPMHFSRVVGLMAVK